MERKFILASNNNGKIREMKEKLNPLGITVISQKEAGYNIEVDETGTTFEEKVTLIKKTKPMKKSESFEAEKKITKDGVTYKLTGVSKKEKKSKKKWKQTVAAYSGFDSLGEAQSASGQKMVTVTDKKTGETVVVPCVKTSTKKELE